ncbi:MAG: amidase [Parachlamydia sp.]|jgi:aspartyl-tRNA(Asn)/glutamyl-tRNA(Gln) amidotransferase subunit A|nr:amidase [Parachlamydia sp.]
MLKFLLGLSCLALSSLCAENLPFSYMEASIDSIHEAFQKNEITSSDLVSFYIERIKEHNLDLSRGAAINAFVSINPAVYEEARRLDETFKATGRLVGPLHGIPIVVKDNVDTYDTPSSSGSLALLGSQPIHDAFIVKKMRDAGAIILGKTSMDEFGNGMVGKSSRSGRTGNPYNPLYSPGGSSGGSAAAVNANFAVLSIGTDNSGSVRVPAAFNGLTGLRPSTGLISRNGIFPRGNLDGVAGPLARSAKDLAILLSVIAKADPNDPRTLEAERSDSYVPFNREGLKGKRIGIIKNITGKDPYAKTSDSIGKVYEEFFSKLIFLGAALVDITIPSFQLDRTRNLSGEIEEINHYLSRFPSTRESFNDICRSGRTLSFGGTQGCLEHEKLTAPKKSEHYQPNFPENYT